MDLRCSDQSSQTTEGNHFVFDAPQDQETGQPLPTQSSRRSLNGSPVHNAFQHTVSEALLRTTLRTTGRKSPAETKEDVFASAEPYFKLLEELSSDQSMQVRLTDFTSCGRESV
jgi:hypothetical protein